ncbi:GNAT family N-acetyltransferase [Deinococcus aquiradiocola]|uniref:GNAT family N-acetyltransferase n=1 Tax=Deinococcus aquiradiocola TaxID=393059 RepID=A0A917PM93_9DEIO|nr:GNAT family N-acetyltransferase [Deinococcus aquiradiocola]GGJ84127.1 GNAT family N-acetyltransferase [Deinococcus aquiradiocola]
MTFTVRPATPQDLPGVADLYSADRPGNPATPAILRGMDEAQALAGAAHARLVAVRDGQVIGAAELLEPLGARAPGSFWLELVVRQGARGQGVATRLASALRAALEPHAPTRLKVVVSEANPVALRFAQRHGFHETERYWDRTLPLAHFDAARHARPLPPGMTVTTLTEYRRSVPDADARLHPLYEEARADLPRDPGETYTPLPLEHLTAFLAPLDPDLVFVARHGPDPLGFTALEASGALPPTRTGLLTPAPAVPNADRYELMIAMTGVLRAHRGQGIARALKLASMTAARDAGWAVIRTSNHSGNLGMLRVNDALGFGREPARLGLLRTLPAAHPALSVPSQERP